MIEKPTADEYHPYYESYIQPVLKDDIRRRFDEQVHEIRELAAGISEERETYAYAPGKWTIRQVVGHLIDAERVFGMRMFRVGRLDDTAMPGFDENQYIDRAPYHRVALAELVNEFALVRQTTVLAMDRFSDEEWKFVGNANGAPVSARALAYMTVGHVRHHMNVLRDRYGA